MDIKSKDILKQALKAFDGTLVIVSHDRDFLDGLVDKVYEFRDSHVREFLGGVGDFLRARKLESLKELERKAQSAVSAEDNASPGTSTVTFTQMKERSKEEKKKKNRIVFLEKEIEKLEKKMKEIETVLSAPKDGDDIMELTREYLECKRDLDAKASEWGELID